MLNRRTSCILILIVFALALVRYTHHAPKRHYSDFRVYHATAERFIEKQDIYAQPDPEITPFKYSPMFAFIVSPLGHFSRNTASMIYFTINFFSLLLALWLSMRLVVTSELTARQRITLHALLVVLCFRFILQGLYSGQVSILVFTLVLGGLYYLRQKRDVAASALIGLAIMIKYMPLVFIPYLLLKKKFKVVMLTGLFVTFYCFIPASHVGLKTEMNYLKQWAPLVGKTSFDRLSWYHFKNQSFYSGVLRFFTKDTPYRASVARLEFRQGLLLGFFLAFLIYAVVVFPFSGTGRRPRDATDYAALFICMAIMNPNAWMHNFIVLLFPYLIFCYSLVKSRFKDWVSGTLVAVSFLLASVPSESIVGNYYESVLEELSFVTLGALVLLVGLVWRRHQDNGRRGS